jgi:hypothetical protein
MSTMTGGDTATVTGRERYAGWANRETWAAALWLNNEQGMQESVHEAIREAVQMRDELTASGAGEVVREYIDELFDLDAYDGVLPSGVHNMMQDIGSLWRVDWREVGAAFLCDATEQSGCEL